MYGRRWLEISTISVEQVKKNKIKKLNDDKGGIVTDYSPEADLREML